MGADLYIPSLYEPNHKAWEVDFERAATAREAAPDEASRQAAQVRVEQAYELMYSRGYFRDSYNDSILLWKFGLSWWSDIIPMLDKESDLSPAEASRFLEMLSAHHAEFETEIAALPAEEQADFRRRYAELQKFLQTAIELDEAIMCSL